MACAKWHPKRQMLYAPNHFRLLSSSLKEPQSLSETGLVWPNLIRVGPVTPPPEMRLGQGHGGLIFPKPRHARWVRVGPISTPPIVRFVPISPPPETVRVGPISDPPEIRVGPISPPPEMVRVGPVTTPPEVRVGPILPLSETVRVGSISDATQMLAVNMPILLQDLPNESPTGRFSGVGRMIGIGPISPPPDFY